MAASTTTTPDDLEQVRGKLAELAHAGRVDELIELVLHLLLDARNHNTALQARLGKALRELYGKKSEKISPAQLALLFDKLGDEVPADIVEEAATAATSDDDVPQPPPPPAPRTRRGHGRSALPANLPREPRIIPVAKELRTCAICGNEKECIGHITSEILEFVPASFKVIEEQREKLACKTCENGVVAAPSEKPMSGGRPGPALLAHLVVDKFQDAMPIYRQAQAFERCGVALSTSTLGDWTTFAIEVLRPIARAIVARVLRSFVIGADDTGIRVLDRDHEAGVKRGHMFAYVGDHELVAFDYTPDWSAKGPGKFLEHFDGFVQTDGYKGWPAVIEEEGKPKRVVVPPERRLGCAMHVRRPFEAAAKARDARAAIALAYFQSIYKIERECKEQRLDVDARLRRRQQQSVPVVNDLFGWLKEMQPKVIPSTPISDAIRYATNQEVYFRRCFDDGRFEIDNGEVERQLRRVALGRKNFLFAGSDAGAERIAVAYTVLGSCHMQGINPLAYITDVITKVQNGWPNARRDELLPTAWKRAHSLSA